jgi:ATP-dependent Clp protease ATP-binding subunit ClpX
MYKCDFCGKDQTKVKRLIAAPNGICICNKCVFICVDVLLDNMAEFKELNFNDAEKKEGE